MWWVIGYILLAETEKEFYELPFTPYQSLELQPTTDLRAAYTI